MFALELTPGTELLIAAVAGALLHFLWQGVAIAVAYAALCRLFGAQRPRVRVAAGYLALAAMAVAPLATVAYLLSGPSAPGAATMLPSLRVLATEPSMSAGGTALAIAYAPWLVGAWLAGVALVSLRGFRHWAFLRQVRMRAGVAEPAWQTAMTRLLAEFGLRARIELKLSADIATPILIGWLKPAILLPAAMCARLPREQVELLIAHELAHVRRFDHLFNLLQIAVETVLFYHPVVHWISRRVRDDREQCCDDLVTQRLGARLSYARALLSVAESAQGMRPGLALAASGGQLFSRIARIVDAGIDTDQRSNLPQALLLIGALGMATLVAGRLAGIVPVQTLVPIPVTLPVPSALSLAGLRPAPPQLPVADLVAEIPGLAPRVPAVAAEPLSASVPAAEVPAEPVPLALVPAPGPDTQVRVADIDPAPPAVTMAAISAPEPVQSATATQPRLLHAPAPEYPKRARTRGIEGAVTLSYRVAGDGSVADVRVESARPAGIFDRAASEAVSGWRFAPEGAAGERYQQVIEFRLTSDDGDPLLCERRTGSQICR
ncbi:MAG TPA: TonB family protein [Xanthomonadaceae bacterium]|nr:TonB family protein [Xanthomonadaceae bacterium]